MSPARALVKIGAWTGAFGWRRGLSNLTRLGRRGSLAAFRVPGTDPHPVWARSNRSDTVMFHQIFVAREYDYDLGFRPTTILDAGANAGYATRFFLGRYPDAKVIAVEPDPENCQVFRRNTAHLPEVELIQGGLWSEPGWLRIARPDAPKSEVRLERATDAEPGALQAWTIPDLLRERGWDRVDLVKLDVEGAEREIFAHGDVGWLRQTRALIVELHDRTTPGCARALFDALHGLDYALDQRGDTLLIRMNYPVQTPGGKSPP